MVGLLQDVDLNTLRELKAEFERKAFIRDETDKAYKRRVAGLSVRGRLLISTALMS